MTRPPLPPCSRKRWGRIPTPVTRSLARNDSAPRWERRDTWVPPYGVRRSSRADRVVRPYNGTSGTPSPTHSVIARSEATRQSVLPSPKRRIPAPVTRSLARNDSAARWERRDTWVPPYRVRRSSRAGRVVRSYKAKQEPRETGRRGRRPLQGLSAYERAAPVGAALFFIVIASMRR